MGRGEGLTEAETGNGHKNGGGRMKQWWPNHDSRIIMPERPNIDRDDDGSPKPQKKTRHNREEERKDKK